MNYSNKLALNYKIADAIYNRGPMDTAAISDLFPVCELKTIQMKLGEMHAKGDVERVNGTYHLRAHVRRHFSDRYADKSQIAGPREFFAVRPLSAKHIPSTQGRRPGADDFRNWGSRHV